MDYTDPTRRHDFVLLADVKDGNMNGDPDAGNLQRTDPDTGQGLATDVCFKRKVRNFAALVGEQPIYIEEQGLALNDQHQKAYDALSITPKPPSREKRDNARDWMCQHFWDVRMFGGTMSTGVNAGQIRGPVQMNFARTVDKVVPQDITITRSAITREEDRYRKEDHGDGDETVRIKETEMGKKTFIPYGLFVSTGYYAAHLGMQTGVTEEDLSLFWQALANMFELDRSASKGLATTQGLYVFTHENKFGNAPAQKLFNLIRVERNDGVDAPRHFSDYTVSVDEINIPDGVSLDAVVEARTGVAA
jgi:CRISPR-associated protein Csd2